jgi:adenylylsulfate kinase
MKILICGLPGSGKTTLAKNLVSYLIDSKWYNADEVRKQYNDWDFSDDGRIRQALRMKSLAEDSEAYGFKYVLCDFVAPTEEIRNLFKPDFTIWMNTIDSGRFEDTNKVFTVPTHYNFVITNFNDYDSQIDDILNLINMI